MINIYAKSKPPESLIDHTNHLLQSFERFKRYQISSQINNYSECIKRILYYHDQGKANIPFQNLIRKSLKLEPLGKSAFNKSIPHEWLSLSFISEEDESFFHSLDYKNISFYDLACYSIAFHHSRSFPANSKELELQVKEIIDNSDLLEIKNELYTVTDIKGIQSKIESPEYWPSYFPYVVYFKGILHKCDYAASAHIEAEQVYEPEGKYSDHFTEGLKKKDIKALYDYQLKACEYSDKSIIFIASTGAGKTEYSMNWINGDKAFYLLGLRTAVNAMYDRFTDMFSKENVGLLHGESIYRLLDDDKNNNDYEDDEDVFTQHTKIRQLSMPITVATADQLIPSVFKFPGFEFYYFTASYSKIVIDEIQSFAPETIASIVVFLKEIQRLGGKFLLMTATLPQFIINEFNELYESGVLARECFHSQKRRHVIKLIGDNLSCNSAEQIIDDAFKTEKKVLVISNTVAGAQRLAERYSSFEPELLHSRFIRSDRKKKEDKIFDETDYVNHPENKNKSCLWISTQIVEASLDIDFDILLTENATIDALFQRFGRCWRKRVYDSSEPNIYIFKPEDEGINNLIYDKEISEKTWNILMGYNEMHISEEDKQEIIDKVFSDIENTDYYKKYKRIKELLTLGLRAEKANEARDLFRNINSNYTVIPEPVFNKHKEKIEQLFADIDNRELGAKERYSLKNELFGFTVPVQLLGKRHELLHPIPVLKGNPRKLDIWLLEGVNYDSKKGAEFIKCYKTSAKII